jgi:hypothetical protein
MRPAALAMLVVLVGCVPAVQHPEPAGSPFESDDVRFVAPTGWEMRQPTPTADGASRILVYLATQVIGGECGLGDPACTNPLDDELQPGGMLVIWAVRLCAGQSCDLPSAPLISIGNRQGVATSVDAGCEATGSTERVAYFATVTPQRVDILLVCARNPSDATRSAFLGFLDAIQWRIP